MAHANDELARREMELLSRGDDAGAFELYADDVVFIYDQRALDEFLA